MPTVFDPMHVDSAVWPQGNDVARAYIGMLAQAGVGAMVRNVRTRWLALLSGEHVFPLTVNDGETGDSYVCLPHSAYCLYAREELDMVDVGAMKPLAKALISVVGALLQAAGINRIVHVDNWLLSTNLHGDWKGDDIPAIRAALTKQFPQHIIAIRSLDAWSCPELLAAVRADGWTCVPSRQIWVTDDLERNWRASHSAGNDRRMMARQAHHVDELAHLREGDAQRIAALYEMLYVGKYSALNPVFTEEYIAATHADGTLRYRAVRNAASDIVAVAGCLVRGDVLTAPIVGYDTSRPQSEGLYRAACYLFSDLAASSGLRLNGSAGAADFKRHRGARGEIEFTAMYVGHLSVWRACVVRLLAAVLNGFAVPIMKKRGL